MKYLIVADSTCHRTGGRIVSIPLRGISHEILQTAVKEETPTQLVVSIPLRGISHEIMGL